MTGVETGDGVETGSAKGPAADVASLREADRSPGRAGSVVNDGAAAGNDERRTTWLEERAEWLGDPAAQGMEAGCCEDGTTKVGKSEALVVRRAGEPHVEKYDIETVAWTLAVAAQESCSVAEADALRQPHLRNTVADLRERYAQLMACFSRQIVPEEFSLEPVPVQGSVLLAEGKEYLGSGVIDVGETSMVSTVVRRQEYDPRLGDKTCLSVSSAWAERRRGEPNDYVALTEALLPSRPLGQRLSLEKLTEVFTSVYGVDRRDGQHRPVGLLQGLEVARRDAEQVTRSQTTYAGYVLNVARQHNMIAEAAGVPEARLHLPGSERGGPRQHVLAESAHRDYQSWPEAPVRRAGGGGSLECRPRALGSWPMATSGCVPPKVGTITVDRHG